MTSHLTCLNCFEQLLLMQRLQTNVLVSDLNHLNYVSTFSHFLKKKKKPSLTQFPPPQKKIFFHKTLHSIHISKIGLNHTEAFIMFTLSKFSKKNYTGQNNNITWTGSHTTLINRHLPFQFITVSQMIWCTLKSKQVTAQRLRTTGTCFITLN